MCVARVAYRVRSGGHFIPSETVRRHYHGGLRNFFQLYRPLANNWRFYDTAGALRLTASFDTELEVHDSVVWNRLESEYEHDI